MEFDYEIVYRPGRVHQVPDALSRLLREGGAKDDATIDEEIPSFGDQHQVQPEPAHSVQVVTRARFGKAPSTVAANAARKGQPSSSEIGPNGDGTAQSNPSCTSIPVFNPTCSTIALSLSLPSKTIHCLALICMSSYFETFSISFYSMGSQQPAYQPSMCKAKLPLIPHHY